MESAGNERRNGRIIDLTTSGRPLNFVKPIVGRVALEPDDCTAESVLVTSSVPRQLPSVRALITTGPGENLAMFRSLPVIHSVRQISHLKAGDVVVLRPLTGHVRTVFRPDSKNNALLFTERCNSFCLMCSQPPIDRNDSELVEINLEAIRLMVPKPKSLGITGGEPTLLGDDLFRMLEVMGIHLPETHVHMLTNGRRFAWPDFTAAFIDARPERLAVGIPLYADNAPDHDYVVQARGAFDQTIQGLHQLARYEQFIEIRVVLHALTIPRLTQLVEYIYRNLPFVNHIALMGLEITGFTRPNLEELWIDPYDYRDTLRDAVEFLAIRRMNVSIYNHQLCILPRSLWGFARQSISDWKNLYLGECDRCLERERCGGFFASAVRRHSDHIQASVNPR